MGDPKRQRKKYSKPSHPWLASRIEEEKAITKEYGLKNKKEIWRAESLVRNFTRQAKRLIVEKTEQARKEEAQLLDRLKRMGLEMKHLEDVLGISVKDILEKRLQTVVIRKGLARTTSQARQFITHGHITVGNKKLTIPSFLVPKNMEPSIGFAVNSSLFKEEHPERIKKEIAPEKKKKAEKPEEKKKTEEKPKKKAGKKNETHGKKTKT
ncbi:30S ribosomal protein S4 [Candidatus Woesearchaeota archaeon]|nr:30S ribosomal protein S4 [Candidatus Woesearchaeota archaeon]